MKPYSKPIKPVAQKTFDAIMLDSQPEGMAPYVDYGLDGWDGTDPEKVYQCYHYGIRNGHITLEAFNEALGDGPKLTALVNGMPGNPHPGIVIKTAYDEM